MLAYKFTKSEIDKILDTLIITVDTREQKNHHIRDYFVKRDIKYANRTMSTGDYGCYIPANPDMGIMRDLHIAGCLERKATVDELVGNFSKDNRTRFENEMIRAAKSPFVLLIEDEDGYRKILEGDYWSDYNPKSLLGSLKSFEARYNFSTVFVNARFSGNYIYHHFYYLARELLKA
ncbi:ERCC4 domain-containing protein [Bacillus sp. FSL W7-1360]